MPIIKKTVIITGYACNNNCLFCIDSNKRSLRNKTTLELFQEIKLAKKSGSKYIEFIGGEFTIRPDALDVLRYAKKLGFPYISMATNGRMLSYEKFAKDLVDSGITEVIFSIHGHDAQLHDKLVGAEGAFQQMMQGLDNLRKLKFAKISANVTIVKQNFKFLPEIAKLLESKKIKNTEFIFVDPTYGAAFDDFENIVPRITDVVPFIRSAIDRVRGRRGYGWHIRYFPLCYFSDYLDSVSELNEIDVFKTEHIAPDFVNVDVSKSRADIARIKLPEICDKCRLNNKCEGLWKEYVKYFGFNDLKAVK